MKTIFTKAIICAFMLMWLGSTAVFAGNYIVLLGNDTIYIEQGYSYTDPGAEVYDNSNTKISGVTPVVTESPRFTTFIPGTYIFKYNYSDTNGSAPEVKRVVIVTPDKTAPELLIERMDTIDSVQVYYTYTAPNILKAYDTTDGDLKNNVVVISNVNTNALGFYKIVYSVADMSQNTTKVEKWVRVFDSIAPVVHYKGNTSQTWYVGDKFYDSSGFTVTDNIYPDSQTIVKQGSLFDTSVIDSNNILKKAGLYTFRYVVTDQSGNTGYSEVVTVEVKPYRTYNVTGTISLEGSSATSLNATVYLIKFDAADSTLTAIDTYMVASGTAYAFNNILPGDYLLKAALDSTDTSYSNYMPTYYTGELKWDKATTVTLNSNKTVNIQLLQGNNSGGPGFIAGKVSQGANKKEGDPLKNIQLVLTTVDDKPVAYTYSDENGYFEFKNLALGEYKLYGEVAGLKTISGEIKLTQQNQQQTNIDVVVNSTYIATIISASTSVKNQDVNASIKKVYPNPAVNTIFISTDASLKNIQLFNMAGQQLKINYSNNSLQVSDLPNGSYILLLNFNNGSSERKLVNILH